MRRKLLQLSVVKRSADWKKEREKTGAMIATLSDENLLMLEEILERLALNEKAASPLRRQARKNRILTERAGKIKRIK